MKRYISIFTLLCLALAVLCSCGLIDGRTCRIDFVVEGEYYTTTYTVSGSTANLPDAPSAENLLFYSWYLDEALTEQFNPTGPVWTDLTLYAGFVPDAVSLTNSITQNTVRSLVKIKNICYNTGVGAIFGQGSTESQGSGVVYQVSAGCCYVLTNAHVAKAEDGYKNQSFTVIDAWGNEYSAELYKNPTLSSAAYSSDSDLALLWFEYTPSSNDTSLEAITLAQTEAEYGDYVVSLGAPLGQMNAVTVGRVLGFGKIKLSDGESKFDGVYHDAPIDHGSSGGPFVNINGELVGLNFAGNEDGNFGCAVPLSVINKFIDTYVYGR